MSEPDRLSPHDDLLGQLFFLLTARFEDGAGIAASGQNAGIEAAARIELANRLHALAQETMILADAVVALSHEAPAPAGVVVE